jgi:DASS family divalent anion:Na+ symporter
MKLKPIPFCVAVAVGVGLWFAPVPDGLTPRAWQMFAIFTGTLVGVIGNCLPIGAVAILGLVVTALTGVLTEDGPSEAIRLALGGFSETVIWLVVAAFLIAKGFIKCWISFREIVLAKTIGVDAIH